MKVTVYMPTKNRVDLLARAVRSVRSQTHRDWELIVVNDASTDNTKLYLDQLVGSDSRVKAIHNSHSLGGSGARNIALQHASGLFATGLDDDDYFLPTRLEQLLNLWSKKTDVGPACVFTPIIPEYNGITATAAPVPGMVTSAQFFSANLIGSQIFAPVSHYFEAGLFDVNMPAWQDYEFFMRVLKKIGNAYSDQLASYVYDASPRTDRISKQSESRLRAACDKMIQIHADGDPLRTQLLRLQIYQPFYGLNPSFKELINFVMLRPSPWAAKEAARCFLRKINRST